MSDSATTGLEIGGRRIEVLDLPGDSSLAGDSSRAPLVLLHQGLGSIGLWRSFPGDLRRACGRRLVAFSRYGHGRSEPPAEPRTPLFFHEEALQVLPELRRELDLIDPVLVGHSDGASIALIHAAHHPVGGLVLLAPHVFVEPSTVEAIRQTREAYVAGPLRERMAPHHDDVDAAFWGWCNVWLDPGFLEWELEAEVAQVTAPALLVQGADDPYGTLEQLDRIQARLPGARRLVVPGGHSPHLEHEPEVLAAIREFLSEITGSSL
jgi:pimeloyl-ACP methyl ester carboxylesterase